MSTFHEPRCPVSQGTLNRLAENGWIERRGGGPRSEIKLTPAGLIALQRPSDMLALPFRLRLDGAFLAGIFWLLLMSFERMPDERVKIFYENIRQQVEAERGLKHRFMSGRSVRKYADQLRDELVKRRLQHTPIDW
jgi:hypothetical protein